MFREEKTAATVCQAALQVANNCPAPCNGAARLGECSPCLSRNLSRCSYCPRGTLSLCILLQVVSPPRLPILHEMRIAVQLFLPIRLSVSSSGSRPCENIALPEFLQIRQSYLGLETPTAFKVETCLQKTKAPALVPCPISFRKGPLFSPRPSSPPPSLFFVPRA